MVEATRTSMVSEGTRAVKKCNSANIIGEMERRIKHLISPTYEKYSSSRL